MISMLYILYNICDLLCGSPKIPVVLGEVRGVVSFFLDGSAGRRRKTPRSQFGLVFSKEAILCNPFDFNR